MSSGRPDAASAAPRLLEIGAPPAYCHYADGPCDQQFAYRESTIVFFAYSSSPPQIAATLHTAAQKLGDAVRDWEIVPWTKLDISGQTIFCEICKALRRSATVVADVTTLNFNLMFEIGYAIGLGLPVVPVRDTSYLRDRRVFEEVALLDTLGYVDFQNSDGLVAALVDRLPGRPLPPVAGREFRESPLYVVKGPLNTEGAVMMMSALKKSGIKFRTYDPLETSRLSLHEARKQVAGSVGIVSNVLESHRDKALAHNAQSALIAGLGLAQQKVVSLLLEGNDPQPIDYRDLIRPYTNPNNIPGLLQPTLHRTVELMQAGSLGSRDGADDLLHKLDLGDVAAENEIVGLQSYFVHTGQSMQAKQGHARLVVGRKGSGKTAIFYDVRRNIGRGHDRLTLDLKPEGHQFARLRELVLDRLSSGLQEHTMVSFWFYILTAELARKALDQDRKVAGGDSVRLAAYQALEAAYLQHDPGGDYDFSQRLLMQVDRLIRGLGDVPASEVSTSLTRMFYSGSFKRLTDALGEYLRTKDYVWLLIDNIDKGWPVRGASATDILIVRSLLEAARKVQHQLEDRDVEYDCLVFLRSDIFEALRRDSPDKGKDTAIRLDWEDPAVFQEIILRRVESSTGLSGSFQEVWPRLCTPLIDGQDSFSYIVERTLMRPRDLLQYVRQAVQTAINRGNDRIEEDDLRYAEKMYSEDLLLATSFEIADTYPYLENLLYCFEGAPTHESVDEVEFRVQSLLDPNVDSKRVIELLLWYGFLGVQTGTAAEVKYSHDVQGNIGRLTFPLNAADGRLVVHPAFRRALSLE